MTTAGRRPAAGENASRVSRKPAIPSRRIVAALAAGDAEALRRELVAHAELSQLRGTKG